jgi:ABC-type Fe3+-hydroxamate transport system substrate-binding protein
VDVEAVKADPALQSVDAVVNDRVYTVSDSNIFSRGGPRLIKALQELAGMLHTNRE